MTNLSYVYTFFVLFVYYLKIATWTIQPDEFASDFTTFAPVSSEQQRETAISGCILTEQSGGHYLGLKM